MLRISSFKAVVISNILQFFLSMPIAFAATYLLWRHAGVYPPTKTNLSAFDHTLTLTMLPACLSFVLSSLIAGFVAGRMAEYRPVLHGALSGALLFILTVLSALHPTSFGARELPSTILNLIAVLASLLAGALGGYAAAHTGSGPSRFNVAPGSGTGFVERGLVVKFLASLLLTIGICSVVFFSPTLFCHGGGAGGNCGEGYMVSIPAAFVLSPFLFAMTLWLL